MKQTNFTIFRFDADEGMVFDWIEPHYNEVEIDGKIERVQEHLYAKTLFIGGNDHIGNYKEVPERMEE